MGAVFGGTQSLHTNSLDEAIALPTDFSAKIARETQKYLQSTEAGITQAVDPWAGSYYVEYLTNELVDKAWALIEEIESVGGMANAIEKGIPKLKIEEAATRKQAAIDSGFEKIIGVNSFQIDELTELDTLEVDNAAVRNSQIERINNLKANRDNTIVEKLLAEINQIAESGEGNLLEKAVEAAQARCTLGEISLAMENAFGRYKADIQSVKGVYMRAMNQNQVFVDAQKLSEEFVNIDGRRPRILIAKLGQDGHDRGAKVISTGFADIGFDVDIGPLFQTPKEAAHQAIENDVHVVGVSSLAAGHKTLVPQVIEELKKQGRPDIKVVVGGVIPPQDYDFLYNIGVVGVYGPGTPIAQAGKEIIEMLIKEFEN
jgi:methylmalonyl-CoA mutase